MNHLDSAKAIRILAWCLSGLGVGLLLAAAWWKFRQYWRTRQANIASPETGRETWSVPENVWIGLLTQMKQQKDEIAEYQRRGMARAGEDADAKAAWVREILSRLPSGVLFFGPQGRVREANPAARIALDFASPTGLRAEDVFRQAEMVENDGQPLGRAAELVEQSLRRGTSWQRKVLNYTTPSGQARALGITMSPVRQENTTTGLLCLLTDLTEIRELENEVRRNQFMASLGEMAAGIAHEFKNSLATIYGYAQLVWQTAPAGEARDHAENIVEQVRKLSGVTTEFLAFARPLEANLERVEIAPLLTACAEAVQVQFRGQTRIEVRGEYAAVWGEPMLLERVFINLLRNGCEAAQTPEGTGQVVVERGEDAGGRQTILVRDNGPGIAAELRDKLFIPFFTTKTQGAGLGLAMAQKFLHGMKGSILLREASPGHTCFAVRIPLSQTARASAAGISSAAKAGQGN